MDRRINEVETAAPASGMLPPPVPAPGAINVPVSTPDGNAAIVPVSLNTVNNNGKPDYDKAFALLE